MRALLDHITERSNIATAGAAEIDLTGGINAGVITPENTATITTNYGLGPVSFQIQGRWIDSVSLGRIGGSGALAISGVDFDDATVASNVWFNGQITYNGETSNGATWQVGFNVLNLFDRNPPVIPSFGSRGGSQTVSDLYDAEGRRYQLNVNYSF